MMNSLLVELRDFFFFRISLMVGAPSFSELYLCIQKSLKYPPNIRSSTSVNFQHFPYLRNFSTPYIFASVQPFQPSTPKIFSLLQSFNQFRLHEGTRELGSLVRTNTDLFSSLSLKVWTVTARLTITDFIWLRLRKLLYCR